jgi:hypothetical protein
MNDFSMEKCAFAMSIMGEQFGEIVKVNTTSLYRVSTLVVLFVLSCA